MIEEKIKGQKYKIIVDYGRNGTKRLRHIETFYGGKREAKIREYEIKTLIKEGSYVKKNKMTFRDLSLKFLKKKKNEVVSTTYEGYEYRVGIMNEKIGHLKLTDIKAIMLDDFYKYLYNDYHKEHGRYNAKPLSTTTIREYYTIMNQILDQGVKWGYIMENQNKKCTKPKKARNKVEAYSIDEVRKLLEVLENESIRDKALIYLALDTRSKKRRINAD